MHIGPHPSSRVNWTWNIFMPPAGPIRCSPTACNLSSALAQSCRNDHAGPVTSVEGGAPMAKQVCNNAVLMCSFGMAPSNLVVTPEKMVDTSFQPAANIMDHVPMKNIMPFGACTSLANPQVAAATSAALGVLTPQPCIPNTPAPWTPGSPTVPLNYFSALNDTSKLMCVWGGVISVQFPGQVTHEIP